AGKQKQCGFSWVVWNVDFSPKDCGHLGKHAQRVLSLYPDPLDASAIGCRVGVGPGDPLRFPVLFVEERGLPPGGFGRLCGFSAAVPNAHCPGIALTRFEFWASVDNADRFS